jgi:CHASE1-domain containing sensor protein
MQSFVSSGGQSLLGFDMLSDPTLKEAILRARDSGGVALSEKVILSHGSEANQPFLGLCLIRPTIFYRLYKTP